MRSNGKILWIGSVFALSASFFIFDRVNYLSYFTSLIGCTSIVLSSKGNPIGQALMIIFSALYGIIALGQKYYGEMITYLGMTAPMSVVALVAWLKHPSESGRSEVKVNRVGAADHVIASVATAAVTAAFYFVLKALGTAQLAVSTVSVATSFAAAYFTFRRSPIFAVFYAANDVVLIVLWSIATAADVYCITVLICFTVFLANDLYCFFSWLKLAKRQKKHAENH